MNSVILSSKGAALAILLLVVALMGLPACGGGNEGSGGASGPGYQVTITAVSNTVPLNGSTTILVTVTQDGQPVPDGSVVTFSSSLGGTIEPANDGATSGGTVSALYTAAVDRAGNDQITADFMGAFAFVWINVRPL